MTKSRVKSMVAAGALAALGAFLCSGQADARGGGGYHGGGGGLHGGGGFGGFHGGFGGYRGGFGHRGFARGWGYPYAYGGYGYDNCWELWPDNQWVNICGDYH